MESVSGSDMVHLFQQMHHDHNPNVNKFIRDHEWGIRMIPPSQIPDSDDPIYYNDPFGRVIDWDQDRIRWWRKQMRHQMPTPPIILGPDNSIIDGNHRAQAARSMGMSIQAYVPMKQDEFVVESDLSYIRKLAGI